MNKNVCEENEGLAGGKFRSVHHLKPIAHLRDGAWRRVVPDWADGDINNPHVVSEARLRVRTAPNGDRRILPTPFDDVWFSDDLRQQQIPLYVNTAVKCKHLTQEMDWKSIQK